MFELLYEPWPWYVGGPLIGLTVPLLLLAGSKLFGISSNLRHICAACGFGEVQFFNYNWKKEGGWNLVFLAGVVIGGFLGGYLLANPGPVQISQQTVTDLQKLGISHTTGLVPEGVFNWANLLSAEGLLVMIGGGFLIGFGSRYAGGCTSGHAITGLADLQLPSLIAVIGFFAGGLLVTHLLLPLIF